MSSAPDGADRIEEAGFATAVQTLSSDEFGGRGPASPGEQMTVDFLVQEFTAMGLVPGNGDSWTQDVPLVALTVQGAPALTIAGGGDSETFAWVDDHVAWTKRVTESVSLDDSELVFVGYGVVAPEFGWNDYAGVDVAGKTVVILVNDPGFVTQDPAVFNGNSMTYYGRWTYKFEEAARQGARGAIVVHESEPAGYPFEVVSGSWTGPQFGLQAADDNMGRVEVEGWVTHGAALRIFEMGGQDYEALKALAITPEFAAVPLGVSASVSIENDILRSASRNVVARLPGADRPDEVVMFTAHWDHLGTQPDLEGDQIFNGAFDNATGTAGLLQIANAFARRGSPPARSVVFLAVTAEEQGLLGSAHYAANPIYPTRNTVAVVNMDGINVDGPMNDITVVGHGNSELDMVLEAEADKVGRVLRPDPEPEKGFFYRSDHFSFAKVGIPALYTDAGIDHAEHGEAWTLERRADYTANRYHKPADEWDPTWDLSGAMDDLRLMYRVGLSLSLSDEWPNWTVGNEFRAIREADRVGG